MINLTDKILESTKKEVLWSLNDFHIIRSHLGSIGYYLPYWSGEENWAVVLKEEKSIAYLWSKYPLLIILQEEKLIEEINKQYAEIIVVCKVSDFKNKEFYINFDKVKNYIDFFEYEIGFSMEDLWFYSNSI